jgi:hypothetical protein
MKNGDIVYKKYKQHQRIDLRALCYYQFGWETKKTVNKQRNELRKAGLFFMTSMLWQSNDIVAEDTPTPNDANLNASKPSSQYFNQKSFGTLSQGKLTGSLIASMEQPPMNNSNNIKRKQSAKASRGMKNSSKRLTFRRQHHRLYSKHRNRAHRHRYR